MFYLLQGPSDTVLDSKISTRATVLNIYAPNGKYFADSSDQVLRSSGRARAGGIRVLLLSIAPLSAMDVTSGSPGTVSASKNMFLTFSGPYIFIQVGLRSDHNITKYPVSDECWPIGKGILGLDLVFWAHLFGVLCVSAAIAN